MKHRSNLSFFHVFTLCFSLLAADPRLSQGAVLLGYNFTGGTASPTATAANVSGSAATWNGLTGGFSAGSGTAFATAANTPSSFNSTMFFEFTATANPGFALDLDTFVFDLGGSNGSGTLGYVVSANLRSNAEASDYSTNLSMTPGPVTTGTTSIGTSSTSFTTYTLDLSGVDFNGLSSFTLRVYPFDDRSSSSNFFRMDNLVLNGTVIAVPEPGAWSLLALGVISLYFIRLRKSRPSTK